MKLWRWKILCDLYDSRNFKIEVPTNSDGSESEWVDASGHIVDDYLPPLLGIRLSAKQTSYPLTRAQLNQLIELGDIIEERRYYTNRDTLGSILYVLTPSGVAALEALPNFEQRAKRQQAITL